MAWVTNAHGLLEGHTPDNLYAYDHGDPKFCRDFTREEYELLYKMLNPQRVSYRFRVYFTPFPVEHLAKHGFDPIETKLELMRLPHTATSIGYASVKRIQSLIQQVADEDLPLFIDIKVDNSENTKVLRTILEWRLKCQRK